MLKTINMHFNFNGIWKAVEKTVKHCKGCQCFKIINQTWTHPTHTCIIQQGTLGSHPPAALDHELSNSKTKQQTKSSKRTSISSP